MSSGQQHLQQQPTESGTTALVKTRGKKMKRRKGKMNENDGLMMTCRNDGRTERLCSMPGYNLLSENEKKVNI